MSQSASFDNGASRETNAPRDSHAPPPNGDRSPASAADPDLALALTRALESALQLGEFRAAAVYLAHDAPPGVFRLRAAKHSSDEALVRLPQTLSSDQAMMRRAFNSSEPVLVDWSGSAQQDEHAPQGDTGNGHPDWFCCPILVGGKAQGVLMLEVPQPEGAANASSASSICQTVAVMVEMAQRTATEQSRRIWLEHDRRNSRELTTIVVAAGKQRDLPTIFNTITTGLAKMGYAALISGYRVVNAPDGQSAHSLLALLSVSVPDPRWLQEIERDILGRPVVGLEVAPLAGFPHPDVVAKKGPQFAQLDLTAMSKDGPPPFDQVFKSVAEHFAVDSAIVAPLKSGDKLFGTLLVAGFGLTPADLLKYTNFSQQVSIAVENAQLQTILMANTNELEADVAARAAEASSQRERLQAVLESAGSGIVITTADGIIEYANPAWERLTGRSAASEVRRQVRIVDEDTFPQLFSGRYGGREVTARRPNGSSYTAHVTVTPIFDKHNGIQKLSGLVVTYRDVTEYKEIDRLKSQFLSTASHQLRTPLTTILGFSELLVGRPNLSDYERQRFLRHINDHARRLKELLDDLFDISQFESGGAVDLNPQPLQLGMALEQEIDRWRRDNPGHTYDLFAQGDLPPVMVDRDRFIKQVFRNLLSNATKYSPEGTRVSVVVTPAGRYLEVSVADQGIGMTKDEVKQAFDKFWRADASSTALDGTGLGLVMAKHMLELHGGQIWVESFPGSGTVVRFTLPVYGHEPTVLIVEDEEYVLEIENSILTDDGLRTILARNGSDGIQLAKIHRPDLILLDLMMPAVSGIDVLVALKADPATANIPILVVSARTGWGSIEETYRLGAIDFVAKPFEYDELLSRVRRALETGKAQQGKRSTA